MFENLFFESVEIAFMNTPKKLNDSKTILLIKSLNSKEIKQFDDYLRSPFFNKNSKVVDLFSVLKKGYPDFAKALTKQDLFCKVFPDVKYKKNDKLAAKDDQKLRHLLNYLTGFVQDFLVYQHSKGEKAIQDKLLLDTILSKKLYKLFPGIVRQMQTVHQNQPFRDNLYYRNKQMLGESEFHYHLITDNRALEAGLQQVINNLHYYYLADQLRYFCAAINRENILNVSYDYPMFNALLDHLKEKDYSNIPIVNIYYKIILLLTNYEESAIFQDVKLLLKEHEDLFPLEELRQMYGFVLNFCSRQIKKGNPSYYKEKFEIYNNGLNKGIWNAGLFISNIHFILMIRNALELKEIEWAKSFLTQYKQHLAPKYLETIPAFASAYISFHESKFNNAHEFLLQIGTPTDFYYELYYRTLIIQIYYEKCSGGLEDPYETPISNAIEALRFYVNRNLSDYVKDTYANFVKIMKRLCRVKFSSQLQQPSINSLQKLQKEISEAKLLVERTWLLDKATEFTD